MALNDPRPLIRPLRRAVRPGIRGWDVMPALLAIAGFAFGTAFGALLAILPAIF